MNGPDFGGPGLECCGLDLGGAGCGGGDAYVCCSVCTGFEAESEGHNFGDVGVGAGNADGDAEGFACVFLAYARLYGINRLTE
jgi:hypothetical protein